MNQLDAITAQLNQASNGRLPGHLGMVFEAREGGTVAGWFDIAQHHFGPNG